MRRLFADFADGPYDRPNQRWVCGAASETCACPFGPSPQGKCPELAECQPIKQDDRWECNRPATRGGPCDQTDGGPTPDGQCCRVTKCTPHLSHRARRGRLVLGLVLLIGGVLAITYGGPWRTEVLAPGPLTQSHAQLLALGDWDNRCAACHVEGDRPLLVLAAGSLVGARDTQHSQSQLCMECHKKQISADHAVLAHGVPADRLGDSDAPTVACAACHQEHHGVLHDLTAISNQRCQACHKQRYGSFAEHPEFASWPHGRRTRIVFDHVSHSGKHFVNAQQDFNCAACHVEGPQVQGMQTLGYEATCAACHDASITASTGDGVPLLALPMLDTAALAEQGFSVDTWPDAATGDFDGHLPAGMKLLLADSPALGRLLDRYGAAFSFYDIDPDSEQDAQDTQQLVADLRALLEQLQTEGQSAVVTRLERLARRTLTPDERRALVAGLPVDLVQQAVADWFGAAAGEQHSTPADEVARHPGGGWFKNDVTVSLAYAPAGHADPLLKSWIELIASLGPQHQTLRESALAELATPTSPGQCLSCHSVERDAHDALLVNWTAYDRGDQPRGFTKFAHGPHLTVSQLADCQACHQMDATADVSAAYASDDPHAFVSHFSPITKAMCADCHQPHAAGDSCIQCHNYHVDP